MLKPTPKRQLISLGCELAVYGFLITGYILLVLHYLPGPLHQLFLHERKTYAMVAIVAVVIQGIVLEQTTRLLLHYIKLDRRVIE